MRYKYRSLKTNPLVKSHSFKNSTWRKRNFFVMLFHADSILWPVGATDLSLIRGPILKEVCECSTEWHLNACIFNHSKAWSYGMWGCFASHCVAFTIALRYNLTVCQGLRLALTLSLWKWIAGWNSTFHYKYIACVYGETNGEAVCCASWKIMSIGRAPWFFFGVYCAWLWRLWLWVNALTISDFGQESIIFSYTRDSSIQQVIFYVSQSCTHLKRSPRW